MKKMTLAGLFLLWLLPSALHAQVNNDDLKIVQAVWGKDKKEIITKYMALDDNQSKAFWPVYDAYEKDRQKLAGNRIKILQEYAQNYNDLNDDRITDLAERTINNDVEYDMLHKKYFHKIAKAVGARNAAKFLQLESYIQNEVKSSIQNQLPFIDELSKTQQTASAN
ncbi:hypothetical protein LX64_01715 [Chitinophaga skermanii]|uniref:Sensor of ECF-type sigma factor n=1 Tax=Chitinophaga skermanii TaxID=331697 RepID=A0A327QRC9_9BACT|nr:hypothetical protein [Chitinophaga skermanii]RAJ06588.1 hypothetical protein LX64_01715 [Chitinophaga skermanii]